MTLQQMEYIVAVARTRHFANAARECGVTQPTLSAMIRKLEDELGVTLFERSSQQVQLTPIGRLVVAQAKEMLGVEQRIKEIIAEEQNALGGTFRLAILPTIAPYLLPRFMPALSKKYPELDLRVVEMKTSELPKALENGDIDAAVAVTVKELAGLQQTVLYYEQFVAYVSREDPLFPRKSITVSDLTKEFLWLLDEGHCFRDQLVKFCKLKSAARSKTTYRLGSIETFMRMVESGQGVTFIPELALEQLDARQKELVRPFGLPIPVREVVMLTAKNFIRRSVLDILTESIVGCVPKRMLKLNNTEQRI
ncbi:MAG: hydrogen peroxide-inducible genes activator [Prevotella sp.]